MKTDKKLATASPLRLALGSAAWLRAQAKEKEEMAEVLPCATEAFRREDQREILGLRDAAARMDLLDAALTACHSAMLGNVHPKNPAWEVLFAAQDSALPNALGVTDARHASPSNSPE